MFKEQANYCDFQRVSEVFAAFVGSGILDVEKYFPGFPRSRGSGDGATGALETEALCGWYPQRSTR